VLTFVTNAALCVTTTVQYVCYVHSTKHCAHKGTFIIRTNMRHTDTTKSAVR
jgi:hypothetical protein